jgi:hypothetical protein
LGRAESDSRILRFTLPHSNIKIKQAIIGTDTCTVPDSLVLVLVVSVRSLYTPTVAIVTGSMHRAIFNIVSIYATCREENNTPARILLIVVAIRYQRDTQRWDGILHMSGPLYMEPKSLYEKLI